MSKKTVTKKDKEAVGALTEDQFFAQLVERSGYVDPQTVRDVYRGLVNTIIGELRTKGTIRLPQLADIYLSKTKETVIKNRFMAVPTVKEAFHQVRMVPVRGLKQYFKALELFDKQKLIDPRNVDA